MSGFNPLIAINGLSLDLRVSDTAYAAIGYAVQVSCRSHRWHGGNRSCLMAPASNVARPWCGFRPTGFLNPYKRCANDTSRIANLMLYNGCEQAVVKDHFFNLAYAFCVDIAEFGDASSENDDVRIEYVD